MSKIDVIRGAVVEAMRVKDKTRGDSLSVLLSVLKSAGVDKRSPLMEEEENVTVRKEIKQCQKIFDTAPAGREDTREEAASWIAVYKEFVPEDMSVERIREVIAGVLAELGTETSTLADKSRIVKALMPKVKGKTDGKVANETLTAMSKQGNLSIGGKEDIYHV